ncbi:hypothetical protein CH63R_14070 [Colletotrichum higginsianum IMI 349063]|uniref:DRBM domain-containing protein n=6 Tax=Colletotrichum TaxID=5455 RepID=A0A1B7XSZ0_COLHI|nr:hypothetical protein CH63R_14070 [Colletotrichum higginsianum IMI 349063]OBR02844.1 hypothetical protein CH63R_14070 [Colletotrichum higginsianum IMI 349063]
MPLQIVSRYPRSQPTTTPSVTSSRHRLPFSTTLNSRLEPLLASSIDLHCMYSNKSYPTTAMSASSYNSQGGTWQERLEDACREANILPPVFQIVSDRRGGRTAWSSRVTVHGRTLSARFWYDGKNLNNAKEDAAEMALNYLTGSNPSSPANSRGSW